MKSNSSIVGALLDALDKLPGASAGTGRGHDRTFSPAITSVQCTPEVTVVIPVGRTKSLVGMTTTTTGAKDIDNLRLKCLRR